MNASFRGLVRLRTEAIIKDVVYILFLTTQIVNLTISIALRMAQNRTTGLSFGKTRRMKGLTKVLSQLLARHFRVLSLIYPLSAALWPAEKYNFEVKGNGFLAAKNETLAARRKNFAARKKSLAAKNMMLAKSCRKFAIERCRKANGSVRKYTSLKLRIRQLQTVYLLRRVMSTISGHAPKRKGTPTSPIPLLTKRVRWVLRC